MPGNQTDVEVLSHSFKIEKEGRLNSSPEFIALVIVTAVCPGLLRNVLAELYSGSVVFNNAPFWIAVGVDFCFTILPIELVVTLWNTRAHHVLILTWGCASFLIVYRLRKQTQESAMPTTPLLDAKVDMAPAISNFRSYINIITAFSILAVDFPIYPKYFYKSRVYGTSLMDTGLGFFLVSNAVVSPEARGLFNTNSFRSVLVKATTDSTPLVLLGVIRYVLLTAIGYHVSIYDYGVHWNFFFTLAVVKFTSALLYRMTPTHARKYLGPVVICIHQYFLLQPKFHSFVLSGFNGHGSRDGFLDANREGIISSIGFLAIYFIGVEIGTVLMKRRETVFEHILVLLLMVVVCCSSWLLLELTRNIEPPSRKLANLSYMFFIIGVATVTLVLGLIFVILNAFVRHLCNKSTHHSGNDDRISDNKSNLLEAINYNGLAFFLVANILTGTINICIDTSSQSDSTAFLILNAYMFVLSVLFAYMYKHNIRLKAILSRSKKRRHTNALPS